MVATQIYKKLLSNSLDNYKDGSSGLLTITLKEFLEANSEIIAFPHRIDFFQLILVEKGGGQIYIDEKEYSISDFNIISLSPGQIVDYNLEENSLGLIIIFNREFINRLTDDIKWMVNLSLFSPQLLPELLKLSQSDHSSTKDLFEKLFKESEAKEDFAKEEILISMLKTILFHLERCKRICSSTSVKVSVSLNLYQQFQKLLEDSFLKSRSVQFYADKLNVTSKKLNQIIVEHTGKSTKQIIELRVLLEVKRMLIHTEMSVGEIGNSVGFRDPANFSKFCHRFLRNSPAAFRLSKKSALHNKMAVIDNKSI